MLHDKKTEISYTLGKTGSFLPISA